MFRLVAVSLALAVSAPALAQHANPYAGFTERRVKSLSDEQIADLEAGRGMGLAVAAEMNCFPGPAHVLELANRLELTSQQRQRVKALFESMKAEALPIGRRLIMQETELNEEFASRMITPEKLESATTAIGATQAELRQTHLKYHLSTAALLTPGQIGHYAELRGYNTKPRSPAHEHQ